MSKIVIVVGDNSALTRDEIDSALGTTLPRCFSVWEASCLRGVPRGALTFTLMRAAREQLAGTSLYIAVNGVQVQADERHETACASNIESAQNSLVRLAEPYIDDLLNFVRHETNFVVFDQRLN